jgi:putative flavoprotein involved in K+ transport
MERIQTVVIGGGQAGLSVGYHLKRRGLPFAILDANARVGDVWRNRWDSLRLFTPARFDGLDGAPFPARPWTFPTKDEMADYLDSYAARFALPVHTGERVTRLARRGAGYVVETTRTQYEAEHVIVAMSNYQQPHIPAVAGELNPEIVQIHARDYRNPGQLKPGPTLIVGAGNSGADIGLEVVKTHRTWLAGRDTGQIPFRIEGTLARLIGVRFVIRFVFHHILTVATPLGRKARPTVIGQGGPRIRVKASDLAAAGVERVPRLAGVRDGKPLLTDGRVLDVANVIWCTGFQPGFDWIDLPIVGDHEPMHRRGIVDSHPGLYFVGLHFLYSLSSAMIHGVGRDAARIVDHLVARTSRRGDGRAQRAA